jgi:hypothetical protein
MVSSPPPWSSPFGNVLGVMYSQHYLDMLASGTAG